MRREIEGYRISPEQRRMFECGRGEERSVCEIKVKGEASKKKLKETIERVMKRHEALRTSYRKLGGMKSPVQEITAEAEASWEEDKRREGESQQERRERVFEEEKGKRGEEGVRVVEIEEGEDERRLIVSVEGMSADRRTMRNLVEELCLFYGAVASDEQLEDEPIQYARFSEWQNNLLEEEDAEKGISYWREQNASGAQVITLPFQRRRLDEQADENSLPAIRIESDQLASLEETARSLDAPLAVLLLACWQTLLWRLCEQERVSVSCLHEGREYEELQGTFGLFEKWLPYHCEFEFGVGFDQIVARLTRQIEDANKWQDYFAQYASLNAANAQSDLETQPLGFEFIELASTHYADSVSFSLGKHYVPSEPHRIRLSCYRNSNHLIMEFGFDARLFAHDDIARLSSHFETLLRSVINDPSMPVNELDILSGADQNQVLVDFNSTSIDHAQVRCIHHLFEEAAAHNALSRAVTFEDQHLTYEELNARANQLAHYLMSLGIGPEKLVGVYVERSLEMVVAILGILKAGAAYVPLDSALPKERLAFIINDTRVAAVLTQQRLAGSVSECSASVVMIDSDWAEIARFDSSNPTSDVTPDNLIYVIYTSGSTGGPKGVAVEHKQLSNYVAGIKARLDIPPRSSFATVSTLGADLGNTAIFPTLCSGGRLVVMATERVTDSNAFADYFSRGIDCLKIVPSHLAALLTCSRPERALPLRRLVLGGELVNWDLVERSRALAPECVAFNHYGPTETTVGATMFRVEPGKPIAHSSTVPIGQPIPNAQAYLFESGLKPAPIWVTGELHIAGDGLARGYLNRPDLTAEKFIPNPFSSRPGARMYRSGDLARWLPDGNIEYIGRADNQVKLHGYRIELGEVESAIRQIPSVRNAVVVVREDEPGDKRLVAYVVPDSSEAVTVTRMRSLLKESLPAYMLPSSIEMLKELPLTANGKLDRKALPAPARLRGELRRAGGGFRSPVEETLSSIWSNVLGLKQADVDENFFDSGGHSLLAMQLISRVREVFQVQIPLLTLFEAPTISRLALRIEEAMRSKDATQIPPIRQVARRGQLPLSYAQQRLWFIHQLQPGIHSYNLPAAVRFKGALNVRALAQGLDEIIRRHETLRTTFPSVGGQPVQVIAQAVSSCLPAADLTSLSQKQAEEETSRLAVEEARRPFDLELGPLLRVRLIRLCEDEYVVLFTMHHMISDAWSKGIFIKELVALYEAFSLGEAIHLPALPIQYVDYACWQREWLSEEVLERELKYWKRQLKGMPTAMNLPLDHPYPSIQSFRGENQFLSLSKQLSEAVRELSRREGTTLFMTLLAAFKVLLRYYSQSDDIVVGADVANRQRTETEGLIGLLINQVILRTDLSADPSFRELLARVREVSLGAYAHQELPFDKLVNALNPERDLSRNPLFNVMFGFQNAPKQTIKLPGLKLTPVRAESGSSVFDLSLYMTDTNQRLVGTLRYDKDLFEQSTIARMIRHFEILLAAVAEDPDKRLSEIQDALAERDRHEKKERQSEFKETRRKKLKLFKDRYALQ